MKIGWLGLGRLGLPCALALANNGGHAVFGYDPSPAVADVIKHRGPHPEPHVDDMLANTDLQMVASVDTVVRYADVIFLAVQTPHAPQYDGSQVAPEERRDFDYAALTQACRSVSQAADRWGKKVTLVVISTVLPGTMNRCIRPLLGRNVTLAYNPFFIAMSTTYWDYTHPEFVLVGVDRPEDADVLRDIYATIHDRPLHVCSIPSAELTKVAYNTFISAKIAFANSLMEICHHTGADVDQVVDGLELATDRVISPRYMRAGMGDGGACHPRDLIALSWLAERLGLSYDLFGSLARGREAQSGWLAKLAIEQSELNGLGLVVLGKAYKPGTPLVNGSPALLLVRQLREGTKRDVTNWDPEVDAPSSAPNWPAVYVVATKHECFAEWDFPAGAVVIDPFGMVVEDDLKAVTVVKPGRRAS